MAPNSALVAKTAIAIALARVLLVKGIKSGLGESIFVQKAGELRGDFSVVLKK